MMCSGLWKTISLWKTSLYPAIELVFSSIRKNARLFRRDQLVGNSAPTYLARDEGSEEIHQVQKRDEHRQQNIDPRLTGNLRSVGWQNLRDPRRPQRPANHCQQHGQKSKRCQMKRRPRRQKIANRQYRPEKER